jgi:hypothetical protein
MDNEFVLNTIKKFAKEKNLKIDFYNNQEIKNHASTDGEYIMFGIFDDPERMLIAFFHEYAHCVLRDKIPFNVKERYWNDTTTMQYEIQTTIAGLNFAQENGITFSDDAVQWLLTENFSYRED